MIFNTLAKIEPDGFAKAASDILIYIEKETDILFDHSSLEGMFSWVSTVNVCLPAEFYRVNSKNYSIQFVMYYCACENCNKIVYIELIPSNSFYEEDLEDATIYLEEIFPDISIYPFIPNLGYIYYE